MSILEKNSDAIKTLCSKHKVARLFVFGSILNDSFKKSSDIDFLVDFSGVGLYDYADNYFDLKKSLENLLKHKIDLLEDKAVKNPYLRQSIDSSKQLIYGA
ncbi:MAG: nucleotidyltransferase domain-containing protein [Bacteroidetes bacterium]|nr:nucleotidyltransferase domain-containing protein [Bacteroidota bacterium]